MALIELSTPINAPVERVFDLARSIEFHTASTGKTGERAVAGVTSGLIGMGQEVTWEAKHFGVKQRLTVRVTEFDPPTHFADIMVKGAFKRMAHHHRFESVGGGTIMRDEFSFESPLGVLGRLVDAVFLERYMRKFIIERNAVLKHAAESDEWKQFVGN